MERVDYSRDLDKILKCEIVIKHNSTFKIPLLKNNILEYKCVKCDIDEWEEGKILDIVEKFKENWAT